MEYIKKTGAVYARTKISKGKQGIGKVVVRITVDGLDG